jgi:hypothetical protein
MKLFERTKPGRTPDSFLIVPCFMVRPPIALIPFSELFQVGVATYKPRERELIRQRLLALRECAPGTCGHDGMRMLEDVWSRTSAEGRTAVWEDLKISLCRITGI